MLRRRAALLSLVWILADSGVARAAILPAPSVLGDFSVGAGPALVILKNGRLAPGVTAETNLMLGAFTLGVRGGGAYHRGELDPSVGVEASVLGLLGLGASVQAGGPSIDGLLQIPLPVLPAPFYLTLGWRPYFLLSGGVRQELALQLKWSSLLVPDRD